jgi:hypothetical protein
MKILSAELLQSNKRERISGGVYIEFESIENVNKEDFFITKVNDSTYEFEAVGIKAIGDKLLIKAKEVGYWCRRLDHKEVDLRTVIGCTITPVVDKDEIARIYKESCYC